MSRCISPFTMALVKAPARARISRGAMTPGPPSATTRSVRIRPVTNSWPTAMTSWYPMCQTVRSAPTGSRK